MIAILAILAMVVAGVAFLVHKRQPARELKKITVAVSQTPVAAPIWIAYIQGYFTEEGLEVTLQPHTIGKVALDSMLAGKADLAMVGDTPLVYAGLQGDKFFILARYVTSDKYMKIVARKDSGILTGGDLKGRRVGFVKGTISEFYLDLHLLSQKIQRSDVRSVDLKTEEMVDALTEGKVDAVSAWPPLIETLAHKLGKNAVTLHDPTLYTMFTCIVARQDFVHSNPDSVVKFLRALKKGAAFIASHPEEALRVVKEYVGPAGAVLDSDWNIYNFDIRLGEELLVNLEDQARWAIRNQYTDKKSVPNYLNYFHQSGLEAVDPKP